MARPPLFRKITATAVAAMPLQKAPMKNQGPIIVEYQWGSSDITQSYENMLITVAYTITNAGARRVMRR